MNTSEHNASECNEQLAMHTSQIDVLEIIWYQNTCRNQKDSLSETTEAHKASASSHEGACPAFCLCSVVSRALCFRALCTQGANNTIMPWNTPTFSILNTFYKTEKPRTSGLLWRRETYLNSLGVQRLNLPARQVSLLSKDATFMMIIAFKVMSI